MRPGTAFLIAGILLFVGSSSVRAGVHTWVDDDGHRHFGDRVPPGYRSQSRSIPIEPSPGVDRVQPDLPEIGLPGDREAPAESASEARTRKDPAEMSCEQRRRAWRRSKACYAECRQEIRDGGWNNARCGHCREMTRPDC